jgi:hypothetical protein
MKPPAVLILIVVSVAVGLLAVGCGGGGGSSSTSPAGGNSGGGKAKKATAPNGPAGSKVASCSESAAEVNGLRATAVDCGTARSTMKGWERSAGCELAADVSRGSCSVGSFRCQAVRAEAGVAVACARPDATVAFIARPKA